jgi:hypothetical protein
MKYNEIKPTLTEVILGYDTLETSLSFFASFLPPLFLLVIFSSFLSSLCLTLKVHFCTK